MPLRNKRLLSVKDYEKKLKKYVINKLSSRNGHGNFDVKKQAEQAESLCISLKIQDCSRIFSMMDL